MVDTAVEGDRVWRPEEADPTGPFPWERVRDVGKEAGMFVRPRAGLASEANDMAADGAGREVVTGGRCLTSPAERVQRCRLACGPGGRLAVGATRTRSTSTATSQ